MQPCAPQPDGQPQRPPPLPNPAARRKGWARASLALGILAWVFPKFAVLTIVGAVAAGVVALLRARRNPARNGGAGTAWAGIAAGGLRAGVFFFMVFMFLVHSPANRHGADSLCMSNLKQICLAAQAQAARDGRMPKTLLQLTNDLPFPGVLRCPGMTTPGRGRTGPAEVTAEEIVYEWLRPGAAQSGPADPLVRCPVHQLVCLAGGQVRKETKPPGTNAPPARPGR